MEFFNEDENDMTKPLNNIDKMKAIESWQESEMHPLTCGNGKCRNSLQDDFVEGEVVLSCVCGYIQKKIPEIVYTRYKRLLVDGPISE